MLRRITKAAKPRRRSRRSHYSVEQLEGRVLLAATPAEPRAHTLGAAFDRGERAALLSRLTNLPGGVHDHLLGQLSISSGKFDTALLNYMRSRSGPDFFYDTSNVDDIADFITGNGLNHSELLAHGDAVVDHKFPDQFSAGAFDVQLPAQINWIAPGGSTNPEFLHSMNRQEWWREVAWISAIRDDDPKYWAEIEYELASWSLQNPVNVAPDAWTSNDKAAWLLDSSLRAESWSWAYFGFLDHPDFTGEANSLFLYKLLQNGDYLYEASLAEKSFASNKTIVHGKGLLYLGQMLPEIDNADLWESSARNLLFRGMDAQIYPDGSHVEQSPGYIFNVSNDLLDAFQLDRLNEVAWPKDKRSKLIGMIDSYWQFLSPNGRRPAIGDSYRNNSLQLFNKPAMILETNRWSVVRVGADEVFVAGVAAATPLLTAPSSPSSLGERGNTYAMPNSGNYVMRSGDDRQARQVIFDAGPKGFGHGHFDLLNLELSGFGRTLISDPGQYKLDNSASRNYVISTQAHNTINVDGLNHLALEGTGNPNIFVSQFTSGTNFAQVTASHRGYTHLGGAPIVTRSIWYDLDGTMIVVDWGLGSARHQYQQSFNLQTEGSDGNVTIDAAGLSARTNFSSGGNVKIQAVRHDDGQTASAVKTFVTNSAGGDYKDDAFRFTLQQSGKFVVMVTLITAYNSTTAPNVSAQILEEPSEDAPFRVRLTKNGVSQDVTFSRGNPFAPLDATATTRGTFNDIAFDAADRLHLVYANRDNNALMYAQRSASGTWSAPDVIDPGAAGSAGNSYQYISSAVDSVGNVGVAYFDGWNGDLKYAYRSPAGTWQTTTVDAVGSTGLYPSLAFERDNRPVISYYNRTNGDLRLARGTSAGFTGFSIHTVDGERDVGRFSSLAFDPTRARWAIGYEDTTRGDYRFALEGEHTGGTKANGFTNYEVEDLAEVGGYVSLAYVNGKPAMSYYDAGNSALRFAQSSDWGRNWTRQQVAGSGVQGLYSQLLVDSAGRPQIFYFDRTRNTAKRAILDGTWQVGTLTTGGRQMQVSVSSVGNIAYSSLDESVGLLNVFVI